MVEPKNIRLGCNVVTKNALAYLSSKKSFIALTWRRKEVRQLGFGVIVEQRYDDDKIRFFL